MSAKSTELVFVYGTLRRGGRNAHLLKRAQYLGAHTTDAVFHLYDCGRHPGVMPGGRTAIVGEVYRVTPKEFQRLDELENYPRYYTRERIPTPWGEAWIYLFVERPHKSRGKLLEHGDWMAQTRKP
ncbi:MAG: gamma-glutamylcyclotransferase family protein [Spongiibacter sp.]|nr:gamma-glutamylcyclotransferase family protein [Spongiibacter sp.]